jgi:hypothetical protein
VKIGVQKQATEVLQCREAEDLRGEGSEKWQTAGQIRQAKKAGRCKTSRMQSMKRNHKDNRIYKRYGR